MNKDARMSNRRRTGINWVLEPIKFLSLEEAKRLLQSAKERAEAAIVRGLKVPVRDYFIIELSAFT